MPTSSSSSSLAEKVRSVVLDFPSIHLPQPTNDNQVTANGLKLCQARAQDLLHDYLDKTFATTVAENLNGNEGTSSSEEILDTGFYLFRHAPPGISIKCTDSVGVASVWTFRIQCEENFDEESIEFQSRLKAVTIDGAAVKEEAEKAIAKAVSSARRQEAAEEDAARIEEERVNLLKQARGERWLPAICKEMSVNNFGKRNSNEFTCEARHKPFRKFETYRLLNENTKIYEKHVQCQPRRQKQQQQQNIADNF